MATNNINTNSRIWSLENQVQNLTEGLDNFVQVDFKDFRKEVKESFEKQEKKVEELEKKYAGKWTERVLIFIWWIAWTAIVGALMTLIIIR